AFAGVFGNDERFLDFVPAGGAEEGTEIKRIELLPLIVVERDGDIGNLVGELPADDILGLDPAGNLDFRHLAAVDGKTLQQVAVEVAYVILEFDVMLAV